MSTTTQLMTAEELLKLPRGKARYELRKGELITRSLKGFDTGVVTMRLAARLGHYVESTDPGQAFGAGTGFKIGFNPDTVLAPDLAFVSRDRIPKEGIPKSYWSGAPDLAVEVVSPGDTFNEVADKVADWLTAGAKEVWIVNPKRKTITIHRSLTEATTLTENDELEGGAIVPGFRCSIAPIFA